MFSFLKSIFRKISGKDKVEEIKAEPKVGPTAKPMTTANKVKEIKPEQKIAPKTVEPKKTVEKTAIKSQEPIKAVEPKPKEKAKEAKAIKPKRETPAPKKRVLKPQVKLPAEGSFSVNKPNIEVVKQPTKQPAQSSQSADWKTKADAAEKIKRAFQGFFYDVASLESLNGQPELKKTNFENYKKTFKAKLDQNLPKLDLLDQQILLHISNSLLEKDIKNITETLEKDTLEKVSKIPDKYIS